MDYGVHITVGGTPILLGGSYCKSNHFKGMPFRHVHAKAKAAQECRFVIQGGDFDFNGAAQEWILKAKASGENSLSPKHEAFMIGTTKNPNNKGFDIFITTAPIPDLNDKLVVFERVINGENIVQKMTYLYSKRRGPYIASNCC